MKKLLIGLMMLSSLSVMAQEVIRKSIELTGYEYKDGIYGVQLQEWRTVSQADGSTLSSPEGKEVFIKFKKNSNLSQAEFRDLSNALFNKIELVEVKDKEAGTHDLVLFIH